MPAVAVTKSSYKYTSDAGGVYRVRIANYLATQVTAAATSKLGATAADGTENPLPGGHYMRRAIVRDLVNKKDRVVPILSPTAPLLTLPPVAAGDNTLLINVGTAQNTYTYQGRFLTETRGRRAG